MRAATTEESDKISRPTTEPVSATLSLAARRDGITAKAILRADGTDRIVSFAVETDGVERRVKSITLVTETTQVFEVAFDLVFRRSFSVVIRHDRAELARAGVRVRR